PPGYGHATSFRLERPCAFMAAQTMRSQLMAAITRSISWLALTQKATCICSTAGVSRGLQMNGSRRSGDLVLEWKPMGWAEEKGQISDGVGPALDKRQRERKAYCYRQQFPTKGDKAVRAQSIRGRMALEGLYVPTNGSWFAEFKGELLSFPAGKHDDQVDALGLIG